MKIPYNRVHAHGDILLAARGGSIHTFSLLDGRHISTWQHPDVLAVKAAQGVMEGASTAASGNAADTRDTGEDEPPAKRQRLETAEHLEDSAVGADAPATDPLPAEGQNDAQTQHAAEGRKKGDKKKGKKTEPEGKPGHVSRAPERPVITQITTTADGRHVLAVSGHDKAIWVFEHDGQGGLEQISQRVMPKRPSAVAIAWDSRIISADKFGDVYALPLIPAPSSSSTAAASSSTPVPVAKPAALAANTLVVHSKRNLEALKHQKKQLELQSQEPSEPAKAGPGFELTLLLGHVSMLTSLALGESKGRRYIVSSDRDEHIRVSRYIPQTHVIEGFCLGHREFVSELLIPPSRSKVLISGGGDEKLFVWDWEAGSLLSKASILSLAQTIAPETTKVAVTGLYSLLYPAEAGKLTYILAICEGIRAIFSWQLTSENTLSHPGVIQLLAVPLHLSVSAAEHGLPKLIIALDGGPSIKGLHSMILTANSGRLAMDTSSTFQDEAVEMCEADLSESEVRRLLYTVESFRKQASGGDDNGAGEAEGAAEMEAGKVPLAND